MSSSRRVLRVAIGLITDCRRPEGPDLTAQADLMRTVEDEPWTLARALAIIAAPHVPERSLRALSLIAALDNDDGDDGGDDG